MRHPDRGWMEQITQYLGEMNVVVVALLAGLAAALLTALGALPLLFAREFAQRYQYPVLGFAAGVMLAAVAFSLVQEGISEAGSPLYGASIMVVGILLGGGAVHFFDRRFPYERVLNGQEDSGGRLAYVWLFVIAITVHNFPEGMAIGTGFGQGGQENVGNGIALTLGIGLQDAAEGLAVAAFLVGAGYGATKSVGIAILTGLVEPVGAVLGSAFVNLSEPLLPWGMALAAGAMLFVIVDEIVPEAEDSGQFGRVPTFTILVGFVVMMFLDNVLG